MHPFDLILQPLGVGLFFVLLFLVSVLDTPGGPAGAALGTGAIMAPGWLAGRAVDKSAMSVANALRDSAARGGAAVLPKVANPLLPYSLPGALTATELQRQYQR